MPKNEFELLLDILALESVPPSNSISGLSFLQNDREMCILSYQFSECLTMTHFYGYIVAHHFQSLHGVKLQHNKAPLSSPPKLICTLLCSKFCHDIKRNPTSQTIT